MESLKITTQRLQKYFGRIITTTMLLTMIISTEFAHSQSAYKVAPGSNIKVSGTSNLHDWIMVSNTFVSGGSFKVKDGQLLDINSLLFVLPVNTLKSKDKLMDTRAYKALKEEKFTKITFKLTQATVVPSQNIIKTIGQLTIGDVTNKISIQSSYVLNADESITCKGNKSIKMSDYNIKAPSFMMGALKTGDVVNIDFLLKLKN